MIGRIKIYISDCWDGLVDRLSSDWPHKLLLIKRLLVATSQILLLGIGCAATIAGLEFAFGPVGALLGVIVTTLLGWLYNAFTEGEEHGVRWFPTTLVAFISLPYFAVVTGYSLLITILFAGGMTLAFDTLRTMYASLGARIARLQVAA